MGAGKVLADALQELSTLPSSAWERAAAAGAIGVLHSLTATTSDPNERAIVMNARAVYEQILEKGRQEGR
ncbi:MAG: hypothetical protein KF837_44780, partial [Labilithrix sp.]|nr:hypothetical protein [Labilithrix sp.]